MLNFTFGNFHSFAVAQGLYQITELMEDLLKEYDYQEMQLKKINVKLSSLKYGFNSLKQDFTAVECSLSELFGLSNDALTCLEEHKEFVEDSVAEIKTSVEEAKDNLYKIKGLVHPCGGPGWTRVIYEDYSNDPDTLTACPAPWTEIIEDSRRFCGKDNSDNTCESVPFEIPCDYNKVCGRIVGHNQMGVSDVFSAGADIDAAYVHGVSVTHGATRQHVWTFAIGQSEVSDTMTATSAVCPCDSESSTAVPQDFVGNDYFCETSLDGAYDETTNDGNYNLGDCLWDGQDCSPDSQCCEDHPLYGNPPYFVKAIDNGPISDDLEIRICKFGDCDSCAIAVEKIEIFVRE